MGLGLVDWERGHGRIELGIHLHSVEIIQELAKGHAHLLEGVEDVDSAGLRPIR